jgi:uncharacterized phiE125 gp8 family phage protein
MTLGDSTVTEILGVEPISLEDAKTQLKVSFDAHDDMILDLISEARADAEDSLNQCLIEQTRTATFDCFYPEMVFFGPASAVTSITYRDEDGVDQTLASDQYRLGIGPIATITPVDKWPNVEAGFQCVRIVYTASPGIINPAHKRMIKAKLTEYYDNPGDYIRDRKTLSDGLAAKTRNRLF